MLVLSGREGPISIALVFDNLTIRTSSPRLDLMDSETATLLSGASNANFIGMLTSIFIERESENPTDK